MAGYDTLSRGEKRDNRNYRERPLRVAAGTASPQAGAVGVQRAPREGALGNGFASSRARAVPPTPGLVSDSGAMEAGWQGPPEYKSLKGKHLGVISCPRRGADRPLAGPENWAKTCKKSYVHVFSSIKIVKMHTFFRLCTAPAPQTANEHLRPPRRAPVPSAAHARSPLPGLSFQLGAWR